VISTRPGILLGGNTAKGIPVAFSGRVPVYVTGEVKKGDYLTISSTTEGYAMKQNDNGLTIGRAISDGVVGATSSLVMMIVENRGRVVTLEGTAGLSIIDGYSQETISPSVKETLKNKMTAGVSVAKEYLTLSIKAVAGYFDEVYAKMIKTDMLCVGNTCVTESQLQQMLQQSGTQSAPAPVPPSSSGDGQVAGTSTDQGGSGGNGENSTTTESGTGEGSGSGGNGTTTDSGTGSTGSGDSTETTESGTGGDPVLDPNGGGDSSGDTGGGDPVLTP
jgi:hypothetical protein